MNIIEPLRLATGPHQAGSGKGCAMNVISWENGDTTITDLPDCSDPMLARIVQKVNDNICTERDGDLLCPTCSVEVLALGHRTVGTAGLVAGQALHVIWVRVACRLAREVAHLNTDVRVMVAIKAAEQWADEPTAATSAATTSAANAADNAAATSAYAATSAAATSAAFAAFAAANAATYADYAAATSAYAATSAASASAAYAASADRKAERLRLAHLSIDTFNELTGHIEHEPDPTQTEQAIKQMQTVTP